MIHIVVAMDANGLIGNHNKMPWHCPADLEHFRKLTQGHAVLMGRKTFESIGVVLPDRMSYVATRDKSYSIRDERVKICHDVESLLNEWVTREDTLYVIGGAQIYKQAMPYTSELWISYIPGKYEGDTWFPIEALTNFQEVTKWDKDGFTLVLYRRIPMQKEG